MLRLVKAFILTVVLASVWSAGFIAAKCYLLVPKLRESGARIEHLYDY